MTSTTPATGGGNPLPRIRQRYGFNYRLRVVDGERMYACRTLVHDESGNIGYMLMTEMGIYRGMKFPMTVEELPS